LGPSPVAMIASDIRFLANPAERSAPSRRALSLADPRWFLAALGVGAVYAIMLTALLFEDRQAPAVSLETEAIPVEIVIEPPPEKKPDPPPGKPEPPAQAQTAAEEPAFDAPRAANNEKTEAVAEAADRAAKPPPAPAPAPAKPPSPDPAPEAAAGPKHEGDLKSSDSAAERTLDKPAEITRPAAEQNHEKPDETQALAELQAQAAQPRTSAAFQLPAYESAPEFDFGSLFKQTPVAGGTAKATYLSTLYGMIVPRMHAPLGAGVQTSSLQGMLLFNVDGKGNLTQRRIIQESGSRDLDRAALEAVRQASPFPPPPQGKPVELRFTYGAK
jgi:TonB family protein